MTSPGIPQSTFLHSRTRWYVKLRIIRITVWGRMQIEREMDSQRERWTVRQTDRTFAPAERPYITTKSHKLWKGEACVLKLKHNISLNI